MSQLNVIAPASCTAVWRAMHKVMNGIIITIGGLMTLTFFAVVILRYLFGADLFAYEEWLMAAAFWMFFTASAMASHERMHINADVLSLILSNPTWVRRRALVVGLLELCILVTLTYWGFLMVAEEFAAYPSWQTTIALKIPFVIPRFAIAFGLFMMLAFTAIQVWALAARRSHPPSLKAHASGAAP